MKTLDIHSRYCVLGKRKSHPMLADANRGMHDDLDDTLSRCEFRIMASIRTGRLHCAGRNGGGGVIPYVYMEEMVVT